PAQHRDGIAHVAGGPQPSGGSARRDRRIHDEPRGRRPAMTALAAGALRGSYPPIVTPFREGRVDLDALASLVERQVQHGSQGIVVAGTTGEPSSLTVDERNDLLRVAVRTAARRITVVAATGSQSLAETIELTTAAEP